ncbi:hypothetical protein FQZ97_891610 [compost metagenome]
MRITQLVEQLARHPLHHVRLALAKGLALVQIDHGVAALLQTDQVLLDRGRKLTRPQAQRGGLAFKGVDDHLALRTGHAVVQGEKGTFLDLGHGVQTGVRGGEYGESACRASRRRKRQRADENPVL